MKPITDLPAERGCSDRTRLEVQDYTAHRTIEAAIRAIKDGSADAFDREIFAAYTAYWTELNGPGRYGRQGKTPQAMGGSTPTLTET